MNIPRHFVHCSRNTHSAAFVDFKRVILKAGHGGDGCIAFARSVYQPMGPPCGGNGGSGASIFIRSSAKIDSLNGMQSTVIAASGVDGSNKSMHGANARDIEIVVPGKLKLIKWEPLSSP